LKKIAKRTAGKLFFLMLAFMVLAAIGFSGCQAAEVTPETTSVETASTAVETAEETVEEIAAETTEEKEIEGEITGNINIFSGLEVSEAVGNGRPIAVMVENLDKARPQSGLISADIVFEVEDEYGITRFVTVFSSYDADLVGPVRSTRPYYAEIAAGFDPIYVFWGTHPSFYIYVENLGLDYLSALGDTSGASSIVGNFVDPGSGEGKDAIRDTSRSAPHNAYIRIPRMKEIAQEQGYSLEGGQSPLKFKEDAPESDRGNIDNIIIDFSSSAFKVELEYDIATNTYLRSCGGAPSTDRETGEQIASNNIVVLFTDIKNSGDAEGHMIIRTTQSGEAYYFIDGEVTEGTWSRMSPMEPFEFKDSDGKTILFNRGQTWISMVSGIEQLEY
jgi:hypothetical protein